MPGVTIRVSPEKLADGMGAMRAWLDKQGVETLSFTSRRIGGQVVIGVMFKQDDHAAAFEAQFNGAAAKAPAAHGRGGRSRV